LFISYAEDQVVYLDTWAQFFCKMGGTV